MIGISTDIRSIAVDGTGFEGRLDFLLGMDSVRWLRRKPDVPLRKGIHRPCDRIASTC
jgi:hypothetical protein